MKDQKRNKIFGIYDQEIHMKGSSNFIKLRRKNLEVKMASMRVIRYPHDIFLLMKKETRTTHAVCSSNESKCVIYTVKSLNQLKIV